MLSIGRFLLFLLCLGTCALTVTRAQATGVPACPAGQVPTWDNSSCMTPQTPPSLSGYDLPSGSSKSSLPGGIANANPAMQDCNGIPIPLGQPCSAAKPSLATIPLSSIPSTIASQTPSTTSTSTAASSAVAPSLGIVGVSSPSGAVAPSAGTGTSVAVPAPAIDATATLEQLLGSWYTGWLQYLAGAFDFSTATQESISTTFLGFPACLQGQQQACEATVWQSISQWIGPSLPATSSGS